MFVSLLKLTPAQRWHIFLSRHGWISSRAMVDYFLPLSFQFAFRGVGGVKLHLGPCFFDGQGSNFYSGMY